MKDGGPAFPVTETRHENYYDANLGRMDTREVRVLSGGMSLRDYFAAKALQGWLSGPCGGNVLDDYDDDPECFAEHQKEVAKTCFAYADAMLAERDK